MFKTTKKALLLFAGAFVASVYTHDAHEPWKCVHDKLDHAEPTLLDMQESGFKEAQEGRFLQETNYPNIRMYAHYTSSAGSSYIQNDLIPPMLSYFEAALRVKYPVEGSFQINSGSICGFSTPSALRNGVDADYVYFVESENDSSGNWVASSTTCSLASGTKRPLVGKTTINTDRLRATNDVLLHEKNMICIMHELTHTLGFSNSLFKHFLDSNGNKVSNPIISGRLDGSSMQIITVSPLKEKLQAYFGCSSLQGAYMENDGGDGTSGSHFERRQFGFEAMTSGLIYEMQFSQFTLAMLESSGWYAPNYAYADPYFFGQGQGCSFLTQSCNSGSNFRDFCSGSGTGCANPGRGGGRCQDDSRSDGCQFVHPDVGLDCDNPSAANSARLPDAETYGRGLNSKCFTGTLGNSRAGSTTSYCFKFTCDHSGTNTVLNVKIGDTTAVCEQEGSMTVDGYAGKIDCPDPLAFCRTVGLKICPRGCMGRGNCIKGVCNCYNGFTGADCALRAGSSIN